MHKTAHLACQILHFIRHPIWGSLVRICSETRDSASDTQQFSMLRSERLMHITLHTIVQQGEMPIGTGVEPGAVKDRR